ncbi:MAG: APC family permease [Lachnospiraceae bacterium]
MGTSTKELKRVLTLKDLMGVGIGQVIGAGIMSLMGVAIALTGRSAPISFLLSALLVLIGSIPTVIISSVVRLRGGNYTMAALLSGKTMAGIIMFVYIITNISMSMYVLSFADYAMAFLPSAPRQLIAFAMAKVQNVIVAVMCAALLVFAAFGVGKVSPDYFTEGFMPNGIGGILQASAILIFATNGAFMVVSLSGEAKNPTRDIPLTIILSTALVAILYAVLGVVASGVLPVTEVAGKTLDVVAKEIMPSGVYVFFVVGGAMFALLSTLNAQFASSPKVILQGCVDGWLPKQIGYLHPKYKTPVVIMAFFYIIGLLPIFFGLDIEEIASSATLVSQIAATLINLCILRLPKLMPEAWERSKFHMPQKMLVLLTVLCLGIGIFNIVVLATTMTLPLLAGNIIIFAVMLCYIVLRNRSGKVRMEISYEEE